MATRYTITYNDLQNIEHIVTIDDPDFVGSSTDVSGYVELTAGSVENPIVCVRGSGLKLILDASTDLDFSDLFTDNERKFKVEYTRDGTQEFSGFLDPEGLFEDYVADKWLISLDCSDGLAFLENLSYVDNSTGLFFSGKQSELTIIKNCLLRTGLTLDIRTSIGIEYTNQDSSTNVLAETFLNADRFRKKDEGATVMNCKEVLCSVLEKYNAVVIQRENKWFIYRPVELTDNDGELDFYRYNSAGVSQGSPININLLTTIGSQINSFALFHCNGNQQKTRRSAIGAYRINYKYGFVNSFLANIFLESSGGAFDDYTVNDATYLTIPASEQGIEFSCIDDGTTLALTSDATTLQTGDQIRFKTKFTTELDSDCSYAVFRVKYVVGATTYNLQLDGTWGNPGIQKLRLFNGKVAAGSTPPEQPFVGTGTEIEFIIDSDGVPGNGDLSIEIYPGGIDLTGGDANGSVFISEVSLEPINTSERNLQGENHTFQRNDNPTSKIKETKEIFNGDNPTDLYVGTIYEDDETTPTETWNRFGVSETKTILEIMGRDTMRIFQSTAIIFRGDVFGFLRYGSFIRIDGINGDFIPIEYTYNSKTNVTTLKHYQIFGGLLNSNVDYEVQFDYGNVVEPTIKG